TRRGTGTPGRGQRPPRSGGWDPFGARRCFAMAERKPERKHTQTSAKRTTASGTTSKGFTAGERAAMKARARELKAEERASKNRAEGERDVLAAIAAMKNPDRAMAN